MAFKIGESVEARMPGTRTYRDAEVLSYKAGMYSLEFDDGSIHSVSDKYVRPVMKITTRGRLRSKSPARTAIEKPDKTKKIRGRSATRIKSIDFPDGSQQEGSAKDRPQRSPRKVAARSKSPKKTALQNIRKKSPSHAAKNLMPSKPYIQHLPESEQSVLSHRRSPGRVKTVGIVSPTSSVPKKVWPESFNKSATIVLHDILSSGSSRSNSRQSISSHTNSELGAVNLPTTDIGRDSPIWLESDLGGVEEIEDALSENKLQMLSQSFRRRSPRGQSIPSLLEDNPPKIEIFRKSRATPVQDVISHEVSDGDGDVIELAHSTEQKGSSFMKSFGNKVVQAIGFLITVALVILSPLLCIYLFYSCRTKICSYKVPQAGNLSDFKSFFSAEATFIYVGFYWIISALSIIPLLGSLTYGLPNKDGIAKYYFNGFFSTITVIVTVFSLQWYEIPILKHINQQDFKLLIASVISAFLIAICLFARSFFMPLASLNPNGYTDSTVLDFWFGREVNPRVLSIFDAKIIHYRMAVIGSIILLISYGYSDTQNLVVSLLNDKPTNYNTTLITLIALNMLFNLDLLLHEKQLITSFELQNDGTGLMVLLKNAIYPFISTFACKYILQHNVRVPLYVLIVSITLFSCGYVLFRYSNNMKYTVRVNPTDSKFQYKDMYLTYSGKHLLVTKTWGFVRHPNYLGHILVLFSSTMPLFWIVPLTIFPFVPTIICILFLLHRAARDNRVCEKKHSSSWTRYCGVAKYKVIPYVY